MNLILVVDESPDIRLSMRELLQARGYRVVSVEGPVQAIEIMRRQQVSVVIADVMMLQLSGSLLLRHVRGLGRTAPPLIALVAPVFFADADGKVRLPVVDARKMLHKPVDVPALLGAIAEALADAEALPAAEA